MDISLLIGIITPAITGLIAYFAAARRMSGQIKTTTAEKLWDEAHDIRESLRIQLEERDARIDELQTQSNDCVEKNVELLNTVSKLTVENQALKQQVNVLTERVNKLTNGGSHA